jgi:subtilisin-like proprotein convertase family protein
MAAGLTRTSTRRAALVGLLGFGLVVGSVPELAAKDHSGHKGTAPAVTTAQTAKAKPETGKAKPETGQVTAASEVTTAAGEVTAAARRFKTVKRTFSHGHAIDIAVEGPSKTYPASITVSGLKRGRIKDVNVRIPGFSHDFPDDVDILLVGPQGQQAIILSDVGGETATTSPRDLTIDDEATQSLPVNGPLVNGTFDSTNAFGNEPGGIDVFPAPASATSSDVGTFLFEFDGTNPNGKWQLFVVDDGTGDGGVLLAPGWTLTITARVRR